MKTVPGKDKLRQNLRRDFSLGATRECTVWQRMKIEQMNLLTERKDRRAAAKLLVWEWSLMMKHSDLSLCPK